MFHSHSPTEFNVDVSSWDVSSVTNMSVSFHFRDLYHNKNPILYQYLQFMFNIVYFSINTHIYFFNFDYFLDHV